MFIGGGILIVVSVFVLGFMTGASGMRAYIRHQITKVAVAQRIAELDGRIMVRGESWPRETDENGYCIPTADGQDPCRLCQPYQ